MRMKVSQVSFFCVFGQYLLSPILVSSDEADEVLQYWVW